jgi:hypothetical protein
VLVISGLIEKIGDIEIEWNDSVIWIEWLLDYWLIDWLIDYWLIEWNDTRVAPGSCLISSKTAVTLLSIWHKSITKATLNRASRRGNHLLNTGHTPLWAKDVNQIIQQTVLVFYQLSYVPLEKPSLIWIHHCCLWKATNFKTMLGAEGLWGKRDLYYAKSAARQDLSFSNLSRWISPFSCLLWHTMGSGGPILSRILTDYVLVIICDRKQGHYMRCTKIDWYASASAIW